MVNKNSNEQSPSMNQWRQLYQAAETFKKLEPWKWMWDSDIFGVENPIDGEIGYCCILGRNKECFALNVYLGTEGLETYSRLQAEGMDAVDQDIMYQQRCLMASFEDRASILPEDLEIIKDLGMKFRGSNQWPLFRSHRPGYFPWVVTAQEAELLIVCLEQASQMAVRFKADPELLLSEDEYQYFVRSYSHNDGVSDWKDTWMRPLPFKKALVVKSPVDKQRIKHIERKSSFKENMTWEVDYFHAPMPVRDGKERPYFPIAILVVDKESFFILNCNLTNPKEYQLELIRELLAAFERSSIIPGEIHVRHEELVALLGAVADAFGINLILTDHLDAIAGAREGMGEFFADS